jgi:hypothetical protein
MILECSAPLSLQVTNEVYAQTAVIRNQGPASGIQWRFTVVSMFVRRWRSALLPQTSGEASALSLIVPPARPPVFRAGGLPARSLGVGRQQNGFTGLRRCTWRAPIGLRSP